MSKETLSSEETQDVLADVQETLRKGETPLLGFETPDETDGYGYEFFPYPSSDEPELTLGSLVTVEYSDGHGATFLITGGSKSLPEELQSRLTLPEGTRCMPIAAPLIKVILGKEANEDNHTYRIDKKGNPVTVQIKEVNNSVFRSAVES